MTVSVSCVLEDSASGVDGISAAFAVLSEALSVFSAFEASFSGAASVTVLFQPPAPLLPQMQRFRSLLLRQFPEH